MTLTMSSTNQLCITNPKAKKKKDNDQDLITKEAVGTTTTAVNDAAVSRPWEPLTILGMWDSGENLWLLLRWM